MNIYDFKVEKPDGQMLDLNDRKYVIIRICQQLYFSDTLFS